MSADSLLANPRPEVALRPHEPLPDARLVRC